MFSSVLFQPDDFSTFMNQNMLQKNRKHIKESWACPTAAIIIFITTGCPTLKKDFK